MQIMFNEVIDTIAAEHTITKKNLQVVLGTYLSQVP